MVVFSAAPEAQNCLLWGWHALFHVHHVESFLGNYLLLKKKSCFCFQSGVNEGCCVYFSNSSWELSESLTEEIHEGRGFRENEKGEIQEKQWFGFIFRPWAFPVETITLAHEERALETCMCTLYEKCGKLLNIPLWEEMKTCPFLIFWSTYSSSPLSHTPPQVILIMHEAPFEKLVALAPGCENEITIDSPSSFQSIQILVAECLNWSEVRWNNKISSSMRSHHILRILNFGSMTCYMDETFLHSSQNVFFCFCWKINHLFTLNLF